jgi:hypothetical protein
VARTSPSKGFLAREQHRVLLTVHALVMIAGLLACALANRIYSPERFWVQWVALGWGALFLAHLAIFSRETLATMGGAGSARDGRRPQAAALEERKK